MTARCSASTPPRERGDGGFVSTGGRVATFVGRGDDLAAARAAAYAGVAAARWRAASCALTDIAREVEPPPDRRLARWMPSVSVAWHSSPPLLAFAGRFIGKLLNMAFGWASTLLFGRVPQSKQLLLSGISLAALAWWRR